MSALPCRPTLPPSSPRGDPPPPSVGGSSSGEGGGTKSPAGGGGGVAGPLVRRLARALAAARGRERSGRSVDADDEVETRTARGGAAVLARVRAGWGAKLNYQHTLSYKK